MRATLTACTTPVVAPTDWCHQISIDRFALTLLAADLSIRNLVTGGKCGDNVTSRVDQNVFIFTEHCIGTRLFFVK